MSNKPKFIGLLKDDGVSVQARGTKYTSSNLEHPHFKAAHAAVDAALRQHSLGVMHAVLVPNDEMARAEAKGISISDVVASLHKHIVLELLASGKDHIAFDVATTPEGMKVSGSLVMTSAGEHTAFMDTMEGEICKLIDEIQKEPEISVTAPWHSTLSALLNAHREAVREIGAGGAVAKDIHAWVSGLVRSEREKAVLQERAQCAANAHVTSLKPEQQVGMSDLAFRDWLRGKSDEELLRLIGTELTPASKYELDAERNRRAGHKVANTFADAGDPLAASLLHAAADDGRLEVFEKPDESQHKVTIGDPSHTINDPGYSHSVYDPGQYHPPYHPEIQRPLQDLQMVIGSAPLSSQGVQVKALEGATEAQKRRAGVWDDPSCDAGDPTSHEPL